MTQSFVGLHSALLLASDLNSEGGKKLTVQMNEREDARPRQVGDLQPDLYGEASREMVRLYKEQFGRGPTRARADFAGPDCLVCTLEDSFTPAERHLAELGEHQRLRATRLFFQYATEPQFCEVIERLTHRKVRAFVSGTDTTHDVSSKIFYFEPI